jgi:hypothetical protein
VQQQEYKRNCNVTGYPLVVPFGIAGDQGRPGEEGFPGLTVKGEKGLPGTMGKHGRDGSPGLSGEKGTSMTHVLQCKILKKITFISWV